MKSGGEPHGTQGVSNGVDAPGFVDATGSRRDTTTYLAWQAHFAVGLSVERLRARPPKDGENVRALVDVTSLIIGLWRLRLAAEASQSIGRRVSELKSAIVAFKEALPGLEKLRNVTMHFDNYALEKKKERRNRTGDDNHLIGPSDLWDITLRHEGVTWLGESIDYEVALAAAQALYGEVQAANND